MRIACVSTLRNEEESILPNQAYHRFLGVTDFLIFLDRSTDGTRARLEALPDVRIFQDLAYPDLRPYLPEAPELDRELIERRYATHSTIRQLCNANMALALCREAGIDWLVCLDPDELICLDETAVREGGLQRFLAALGESVGAVNFRNLEAVPTREEAAFPFEERLFKNPGLDGGTPGLPKAAIFDPFTGQEVPAGWFWGHSSGKAAARPRPGAYFASTHRCRIEGKTVQVDRLLHYNITSFRQFLNKYRNFRDYPNRAGARPLRLLLKRVVNGGFSEAFLEEYYRRHVMYSLEEVERIRDLSPGALRTIGSVAGFFSGRAPAS